MPCYYPLQAWRGQKFWKRDPGEEPRLVHPVVFKRADGFQDKPLTLPCGRCVGCRLERSRQWATRCLHEASLHEENCYLTLTYDPVHVPANGSLVVRDFQLFMKRLRKHLGNRKVRFFHCGEYGDKNKRPHYHALLFGYDAPDRKFYRNGESGFPVFTSEELFGLWGLGNVFVGDVSFESAAYVARYIMKKVTGDPAAEHYKGRLPEYVTMSRRPGIGTGFYQKWKHEIYPDDFVVVRGRKIRVPRFYDGLHESADPDGFARVKARRSVDPTEFDEESSLARLDDKEVIALARLNLLPRSLEDEG